MRYDIESAIAQVFVDYLVVNVDPAIQNGPNPAAAPIVGFFDPMSVDDSNRIIVHCEQAQSDVVSIGNFDARVEIDVKSQWTDGPDIKDDFDAHFVRVNEVRDKLWPIQFSSDAVAFQQLQSFTESGVMIEFVKPRRDLSVKIFKNPGWLLSTTAFQVRAIVTNQTGPGVNRGA